MHWSENSGRKHWEEVEGQWKRPCGYVVTELQRTGGDLPGRARFASNKGQRGVGVGDADSIKVVLKSSPCHVC